MNERLHRLLSYTSWPIVLAMVALMVVGYLAIRVSEQADPTLAGLARKQMVFGVLGVGVFLAAMAVPYAKLGRLAYPLFGVTLGMLVLVLFLPPIRDAHRWINLGVVLVQPSELAKLAYIMMLAWYLKDRDSYRRLRGLAIPFVLTLVPAALILKEPDLGTALLLFPTLFFMLFMAGARLAHLLGIIAVTAVLMLMPIPQPIDADAMGRAELAARRGLAYWADDETVVIAAPLAKMKRHQILRIDGWLRQGDERVRSGIGYQLYRSKMILGSGCLTGRLEWNDADSYFRSLPDDHTDFIFSVVGGQWGLIGCAVVLGCYAIIFLFGFEIAAVTVDPFGRLVAVGVLGLLLSQIFINVGMTMGLMPITGMTLPLVSYGGTSLVVNCAALGLLVNVGLRRPMRLNRRPFEYGQKKAKPPQPFGPLAEDQARGQSRRLPQRGVVRQPDERQGCVHTRQ